MADPLENRFGFADIEHKHIDELLNMMEHYKIEKYIIALETVSNGTHKETNGEHIHFVINTNKRVFNSFKETLKNTYKLSGKNGKTGRYTGWINSGKVKDEDKFISYTVKDKNVKWKGYKSDEIQKALDKSFQKKETMIDELMKYLAQYKCEESKTRYDQRDTGDKYDTLNLQMEIIKFHMDRKVRICKSQVKNLALTYLQLHFVDRFTKEGLDLIYMFTLN